ncbi:MAG: TIGR02300 family protein [Pelagibacterales bacterium]|nr:TIGR02300 family protein [Pelagibacterales bacterium]
MNNSIKGEKHHCSNCGAKFFDLNKQPIICPKCNTEVIDKSAVKTKPIISNPEIEKSIVNNNEDIDAIESEDIENDNLEEDEDDTSTIINIDE